VLGVGYGLGDRLLSSTVPARLSELGYEVWFSCPRPDVVPPNKCNPEAEDLVRSIPGLAGLTEESPIAPTTPWPRASKPMPWTLSCVHITELSFFGETVSNGLPSIGYVPKDLPQWSGSIVADLTGYKHYTDPVYHDYLDWMAEVHGISRTDIVALVPRYPGMHGSWMEYLARNPAYQVSSIYEYLDILHSAKARIVTDSGSQHLCAAIAAPAHVLIDNYSYYSTSLVHGTLHRYWPSGCPTRDVQGALAQGLVRVRPMVYWQHE